MVLAAPAPLNRPGHVRPETIYVPTTTVSDDRQRVPLTGEDETVHRGTTSVLHGRTSAQYSLPGNFGRPSQLSVLSNAGASLPGRPADGDMNRSSLVRVSLLSKRDSQLGQTEVPSAVNTRQSVSLLPPKNAVNPGIANQTIHAKRFRNVTPVKDLEVIWDMQEMLIHRVPSGADLQLAGGRIFSMFGVDRIILVTWIICSLGGVSTLLGIRVSPAAEGILAAWGMLAISSALLTTQLVVVYKILRTVDFWLITLQNIMYMMAFALLLQDDRILGLSLFLGFYMEAALFYDAMHIKVKLFFRPKGLLTAIGLQILCVVAILRGWIEIRYSDDSPIAGLTVQGVSWFIVSRLLMMMSLFAKYVYYGFRYPYAFFLVKSRLSYAEKSDIKELPVTPAQALANAARHSWNRLSQLSMSPSIGDRGSLVRRPESLQLQSSENGLGSRETVTARQQRLESLLLKTSSKDSRGTQHSEKVLSSTGLFSKGSLMVGASATASDPPSLAKEGTSQQLFPGPSATKEGSLKAEDVPDIDSSRDVELKDGEKRAGGPSVLNKLWKGLFRRQTSKFSNDSTLWPSNSQRSSPSSLLPVPGRQNNIVVGAKDSLTNAKAQSTDSFQARLHAASEQQWHTRNELTGSHPTFPVTRNSIARVQPIGGPTQTAENFLFSPPKGPVRGSVGSFAGPGPGIAKEGGRRSMLTKMSTRRATVLQPFTTVQMIDLRDVLLYRVGGKQFVSAYTSAIKNLTPGGIAAITFVEISSIVAVTYHFITGSSLFPGATIIGAVNYVIFIGIFFLPFNVGLLQKLMQTFEFWYLMTFDTLGTVCLLSLLRFDARSALPLMQWFSSLIPILYDAAHIKQKRHFVKFIALSVVFNTWLAYAVVNRTYLRSGEEDLLLFGSSLSVANLCSTCMITINFYLLNIITSSFFYPHTFAVLASRIQFMEDPSNKTGSKKGALDGAAPRSGEGSDGARSSLQLLRGSLFSKHQISPDTPTASSMAGTSAMSGNEAEVAAAAAGVPVGTANQVASGESTMRGSELRSSLRENNAMTSESPLRSSMLQLAPIQEKRMSQETLDSDKKLGMSMRRASQESSLSDLDKQSRKHTMLLRKATSESDEKRPSIFSIPTRRDSTEVTARSIENDSSRRASKIDSTAASQGSQGESAASSIPGTDLPTTASVQKSQFGE